jgi:hypothetical protein
MAVTKNKERRILKFRTSEPNEKNSDTGDKIPIEMKK